MERLPDEGSMIPPITAADGGWTEAQNRKMRAMLNSVKGVRMTGSIYVEGDNAATQIDPLIRWGPPEKQVR